MNILYLGYWSVNDGLSEATIKPHLEILNSFEGVDEIIYISIERSANRVKCEWDIPKMFHIPFYSNKLPFPLDKVSDFTVLPLMLIKICRRNRIEKIIARSSLAGAIAYFVYRKTKTPYYVESFEPHADYMSESGVWSKLGLRYNIQKYFEKKQMSTASGLMPVSNNYTTFLKSNNLIKCPIDTIPCSVNLDQFAFSEQSRKSTKENLNIPKEAIVGIYVGKFGGIYYDKETFDFFKGCFDTIQNFFLILLTPEDKTFIERRIKEHKINQRNVWVGEVKHNKVPQYLSAADFAFSPIKSTPSRKYCSATKNGEYWANGLPIVISKNIGDDSNIIKISQGGGLVVDFSGDMEKDFANKIKTLVAKSNLNRTNNISVNIAQTYRKIQIAYKIYSEFLHE